MKLLAVLLPLLIPNIIACCISTDDVADKQQQPHKRPQTPACESQKYMDSLRESCHGLVNANNELLCTLKRLNLANQSATLSFYSTQNYPSLIDKNTLESLERLRQALTSEKESMELILENYHHNKNQ